MVLFSCFFPKPSGENTEKTALFFLTFPPDGLGEKHENSTIGSHPLGSPSEVFFASGISSSDTSIIFYVVPNARSKQCVDSVISDLSLYNSSDDCAKTRIRVFAAYLVLSALFASRYATAT